MVFQLFSLLMEPQNRQVGMKLMYYTVAMFSVPIAIFYACNDHVFPGRSLAKMTTMCVLLLLPWLLPVLRHVSDTVESKNKQMWSGFVAVASVNVIIAMYVVSAFKEDQDVKPGPAPRVGVWATTDRRTD